MEELAQTAEVEDLAQTAKEVDLAAVLVSPRCPPRCWGYDQAAGKKVAWDAIVAGSCFAVVCVVACAATALCELHVAAADHTASR